MTQKQLQYLVSTIANRGAFKSCDDRHAARRAAEAVLHLMMATKVDVKGYQTILDIVDGAYPCYVYGEGLGAFLQSEFVQSVKSQYEHGEFLVKYAVKIAFGLCAEDASVIEGYIDEMVAYKNKAA